MNRINNGELVDQIKEKREMELRKWKMDIDDENKVIKEQISKISDSNN